MTEKLIISASQIDDFTTCPRRWWFKRVLKLKEVQKGYFTFGTVLHACIERWMAADKQGRVPVDMWPDGPLIGQSPGEPVDVFPPGWETTEENGRACSVTPNEAALIRKLFKEAVEKGILERGQDVQVEREIRLPVLENVELLGYVDYFRPAYQDAGFSIWPPEVHDHKSFGESSVRYLKQPGPRDGDIFKPIDAPYSPDDGTSPNCVGHTQQNLTYAVATSKLDGYYGPVLVRHNQFPKFQDLHGVRKVEALVSSKRLKQHWSWIQDVARRMLKVRPIKRWQDTPGPESLDACSQYGGCPFAGICGKRESIDVYSKRVERQNAKPEQRINVTTSPKKGGKKGKSEMASGDIFDRARQQAAARGGKPASAPVVPTSEAPWRTDAAPAGKPAAAAVSKPQVGASVAPAPAVNSAPAPQAQPVSDGAPWGDPQCPACHGYGINTKGRACPICNQTAKRRGVPQSMLYTIDVGADRSVTAVAIDDKVEEMGAETAWAGTVPTKEDLAARAATPEAAALPAATPAQAAPAAFTAARPDIESQGPETEPREQPVAAPAPAAQAARRGPGRPRKDGTPAQPRTKAPKAAPTASPAEEAPAAAEPAASEPPAKGGRPKAGMTIMLGAVQLHGPARPTVLAQTLLEQVGAELAKDMGSESYWELEPNTRRQRIRQRGDVLAERLGRTTVLVPGGTNDFDIIALVNALMPHAEWVIEGLR